MPDLDSENLADPANHDDKRGVLGSTEAQDGASMAYMRRQAPEIQKSGSIRSEQFTDNEMSAEYPDAEYAVPAEH